MRPQPARLGEYLSPGPVQTRLVNKMATGHAHIRHGTELGLTPPRHRAAVGAHLTTAELGFEVTSPNGRSRYLVADLETNRVAWVNPHREHRSTFFAPYDDPLAYARQARAQKPQDRWRTVDLRAERAQATHRIMSASRAGPGREGTAR